MKKKKIRRKEKKVNKKRNKKRKRTYKEHKRKHKAIDIWSVGCQNNIYHKEKNE